MTNRLYKKIGHEWDDFECLMPIYYIFTDLPKLPFKDEIDYITNNTEKFFIKIEKTELRECDVLLFDIKNNRHFGLYDKNGIFFHITKNGKLRTARLSFYDKYLIQCYRRLSG